MIAQTVILAAGSFPKKGGIARSILDSAERVICCDSAADAYRLHCGKEPYAVVGDCDSVRGEFSNVVKIAEQDTNDLAKAVRFCKASGFLNPVILGATGKREDHTIGNIFRALDFGLDIVTDYGRFTVLDGAANYDVAAGSKVSIFVTSPGTRMTSTGLKWPLDNVEFNNLYCATLNESEADRVCLTSTKPVLIYFSFK